VENVPFEDHLSDIQFATISPDGTLVATTGKDLAVTIWQADSGNVLWGPLGGHTDNICALSFSFDGKMVASGSDDLTVRVWSAETGQNVCGPIEGHEGSIRGICFRYAPYIVFFPSRDQRHRTSPDGMQVASGTVFPQMPLNLLHFVYYRVE